MEFSIQEMLRASGTEYRMQNMVFCTHTSCVCNIAAFFNLNLVHKTLVMLHKGVGQQSDT